VLIAPGVYWVGFQDTVYNIHSNPYLVVEGDEAVLIDGGSRPDFPVVMTKVLQTGLRIEQIRALILHHYDPDLCGSLPNILDLLGKKEVQVLSAEANHMFIAYYLAKEHHRLLTPIEAYPDGYDLNGRILRFHPTPYAHAPGSFVTYDTKTKTLFTSDLFGSLSRKWDLYTELAPECEHCPDYGQCPNGRDYCPLPDILDFHRQVMPTARAVKMAMEMIRGLDLDILAPQHGGVFAKRSDIDFLCRMLANMDRVGIDEKAGGMMPNPDPGLLRSCGPEDRRR